MSVGKSGNGGKRAGAGRKPGVPNKASALREAKIAETGETPLDYMIRVMRDPTVEHPRRDTMAIAAAGYVHSKLAATTVTGPGGGPVQVTITKDDAGLL